MSIFVRRCRLEHALVVAFAFTFGCTAPNPDQMTDLGSSTTPDLGHDTEPPDAMTAVPDAAPDAGVPGITISPETGLVTYELGGAVATFTVRLDSRPSASVIFSITSDHPDISNVSPSSLTFSTLDWNLPQKVFVTGTDDYLAKGNQAYHVVLSVASSADPAYAALPTTEIEILSIDGDHAGIVVTPTSGLVTHQDDSVATATFSIALQSKPEGSVTIALSTSASDRGTLDRSSVTFSAANWSQPQLVWVKGVDNHVAEDQPYTIVTAPAESTDATYAGIDPSDVQVVNKSTNHVGLSVKAAANLVTTEAGGKVSFSVSLTSQPLAPVTLTFTSSRPEEGVPVPASVVFQPAEWATPKIIEVQGVADAVEDGDQSYSITIGPTSSTDAMYDGLTAPTIALTNLDASSHYLTVKRLTFTSAHLSLGGATPDLGKFVYSVYGGRWNVYLYDVASGTETLVSRSSTGVIGNNDSQEAALSADGRFVTFTSYANNLVPGDTNGKVDVFLRDIESGTTTRVSLGPNGAQPNDDALRPSISADSRFIAYNSRATNLVAGDSNPALKVFIWDRTTGQTTRLLAPGGLEPDGDSYIAKLSADGHYVAFSSKATNLVPDDTNNHEDAFVWDRTQNQITRVDVSSSGAQCAGTSYSEETITADGRTVSFTSNDAVTLDGAQMNLTLEDDAYLRDLESGKTMRILVGEDGKPLPHHAYLAPYPRLAAGGRFVGFSYDSSSARTAYVYDQQAGKSRRVVLDGWRPLEPYPSNDGKRVLFQAAPTWANTIQDDIFIGSIP
jgi:hypothetical protein